MPSSGTLNVNLVFSVYIIKVDWTNRYRKIAEELKLDTEADIKAAKILNSLIKEQNLRPLTKKIKGRVAIVFGCGPSLEADIADIKSERLHRDKKYVMIAADGAVKALLENSILADVNVTDLDGDIEAIVKANYNGALTVVHAHGDNIPLLKEIVPKLKNPVGSTQTRNIGKICNFGGFSDGDRAAYLAERFGAKLIALAGMDFGEEIGVYSGSKNKELTEKKLRIGKRLLEELAEESKATVVNLTHRGEKLRGIPKVTAKKLNEIVAQRL